jgi:hypothetical protein
MYEIDSRVYGEGPPLFTYSAGGVSQRGVFAGRGGAGLNRGCVGSDSLSVVASVSRGSSAFVRRHPNRDAVSATTPIDTAAPSTTKGTTELRRLRPMTPEFGALSRKA